MNMQFFMEYATYCLMAIGVTAFIVSVITQTIKELPFLVKIPTNIVVLVLSLIFCPIELIIACQALEITIVWYYILASFVASFIVYLVATGGWERVTDIWNRTKYNKEKVD